MKNALPVALLFALAACGRPQHLTYDFGRAYVAAFSAQSDLTRPSVANEIYPLYGIEGVKIRLMVQSATSTDKSGTATVTAGK